jgi:hypothetical protein
MGRVLPLSQMDQRRLDVDLRGSAGIPPLSGMRGKLRGRPLGPV